MNKTNAMELTLLKCEAIMAAADAYMADAVWRALVMVKRLQKSRPPLGRCPNYIWDAAVEVVGNGNQISAVQWLIHRDLNLYGSWRRLSRRGMTRNRAYAVPPRPKKAGASTETYALLSASPKQSVAFYGLDAKMVEAEGLARALRAAALPHLHSWIQCLLSY